MIELAGHFFLRKKGAQQQMEFVEFVFLFCGGLWAARGHNAPQTKEDERTQTQHINLSLPVNSSIQAKEN